MNLVIIIPSRIGSTRLPNKPLKDIGGISMINHVCMNAKKTGLPVYVATDSILIEKEVQKVGVKAIITKEHPSGSDRVYEALAKIGGNFDGVINLQGDLPFFETKYINQLIQNMTKYPKYDITTLASIIDDKEEELCPDVVKIAYEPFQSDITSGRAIYFSRFPVPYNSNKKLHHIGVYGWKVCALNTFVNSNVSSTESAEKLEQLRALNLGMKISYKEIEKAPISIDTKEDLEKARDYYKDIV